MKRYIVRSVKYFAALCVLYSALVGAMHLSGAGLLTVAEAWSVLFGTARGRLMIAVMAVLAAAYPKIAFITRRTAGDTVRDRGRIIAAFDAEGYSLADEGGGCMTFRANALKRLLCLGEDEVKVRQSGEWIEIAGIRRSTVRAAIRIEGYITNYNRRSDE